MALKHTEACSLFCGTAATENAHEQNKLNDLLCIWCILQKHGISFCLHLWFYHPLLWMSTTKIACTRFFAQICHWFSVCASCLKFLTSFSAPYKFVQAVPYFSCVFKRQQIAKFAKFMKPLSQLLQLFNCISPVFSKIPEILQEYFLFSHFDQFRAISFSCASWNNTNVPLFLLLNYIYLLIKQFSSCTP